MQREEGAPGEAAKAGRHENFGLGRRVWSAAPS